MATSTVPSSGMLIGRSGTCGAVPVRSTDERAPAHGDRHAQRQVLSRCLAVVEVPVDIGCRSIDAVGEALDGRPHHALGIVEQILVSGVDGIEPVAADQLHVALGADPGRGDLGLHVAHHQVGGADVVAQHVPHRRVPPPRLVHLDGLELKPLGVRVDGVDDAAAPRRQRADVEMVRGGHREADQLARVKRRHAEGHVGAVGGATVGVVVHDHVAGLDRLAARLELAEEATHVAGNRPRL